MGVTLHGKLIGHLPCVLLIGLLLQATGRAAPRHAAHHALTLRGCCADVLLIGLLLCNCFVR